MEGRCQRDIGTLGGPLSVGGDINSSGQIAAWGNTTTAAPPSIFNQDSVFCSPPFVPDVPTVACHAFLWDRGTKTDLGALGGLNSAAENRGLNEAGHVVGTAETTAADPTSPFGAPAFHAFLWRRGTMKDLGTLTGVPDSVAFAVNDRDQVVGADLPDSTDFHQQLGWIWQDGHMAPLPTLGGRYTGPSALNDRGQVVGGSSLAGDATRHAFSWQRDRITDLGTLPGDDQSGAGDVNDRGEIVGESCLSGQCRVCRMVGRLRHRPEHAAPTRVGLDRVGGRRRQLLWCDRRCRPPRRRLPCIPDDARQVRGDRPENLQLRT